MKPLIIGTRGSELALAQARQVQAALMVAQPEMEVVLKIIQTRGDQRLDIRLQSTTPLDKGLFTKELEVALAAGEIDLAVHSLKDLPTGLPEGFSLGAILAREDSADLLLCKNGRGEASTLHRVATSSPRRALQLSTLFPECTTEEIRGNVPTRLRKLLANPELDGAVLALAGLKRLGLCDAAGKWQEAAEEFFGLQIIRLKEMLPAPGQGAVAIEIRKEDLYVENLLTSLHCSETADCVTAERALLQELGGGCHLALGAKATVTAENEIRLEAVYFPEGTLERICRGQVRGSRTAPARLAEELKKQWDL